MERVDTERGHYDYRNCQSLFGYAEAVHRRSGGICLLCDAGDGDTVDFDLWRQLTVEHLIGESQGGYLRQVRALLAERFPALPDGARERLAQQIDEHNTVTACSFCNSTTSRERNPKTMRQLIMDSPGEPADVLQVVSKRLQEILEQKRAIVLWKLESVRAGFIEKVEPHLLAARRQKRSPNATQEGGAQPQEEGIAAEGPNPR